MTLCKVDFLKEIYTAYFQGEISESFFFQDFTDFRTDFRAVCKSLSHSLQVVIWQIKAQLARRQV